MTKILAGLVLALGLVLIPGMAQAEGGCGGYAVTASTTPATPATPIQTAEAPTPTTSK